MDIFRMRSYRDNVPALTGRRGQLSRDEFWLAEVVNCTVVADLGPLGRACLAPSLKIDDSHEMVREQSEQTCAEAEPKLSRA